LPPPPLSTLFPYTTLFRSDADSFDHLLGKLLDRFLANQAAVPRKKLATIGLGGKLGQLRDPLFRGSFAAGCGHQEKPKSSSCRRSEEHTSELQSLAYLVCR